MPSCAVNQEVSFQKQNFGSKIIMKKIVKIIMTYRIFQDFALFSVFKYAQSKMIEGAREQKNQEKRFFRRFFAVFL